MAATRHQNGRGKFLVSRPPTFAGECYCPGENEVKPVGRAHSAKRAFRMIPAYSPKRVAAVSRTSAPSKDSSRGNGALGNNNGRSSQFVFCLEKNPTEFDPVFARRAADAFCGCGDRQASVFWPCNTSVWQTTMPWRSSIAHAAETNRGVKFLCASASRWHF